MAGSQASGLTPAEVYEAPTTRRRGSRIPTLVWLLALVAAMAGGWYVGHEVTTEHTDYGELQGHTSVTEDELDRVIGTYVLDGETATISVRDAIAQQTSLDVLRNADGSYRMPSTESVIAAARTAVIMREVANRGIEVTDDDLIAYARETFGTDDLASLAAGFTMDEDAIRDRLRESAAMAKLRAEVVSDPGTAPAAPDAPPEDDASVAAEEYASYIFSLAGDEWDSERGVWVSEDGPYATALHDYDIRSDAATYEAALVAYEVAYQRYSEDVTSANTEWTEFVNGLLCNAELAVSTLGS